MQGVAKAIEWTQTNPRETVIARFETIIDKRGREREHRPRSVLEEHRRRRSRAASSTRRSSRSGSTGWSARATLKKGQVDPEDLYTNEFNPYSNGTYDPASGPDGEAIS